MTEQAFDPTRFFDHFPRFLETDQLGSVVDRLNARYLALIHENRKLIEGATVLDLASHDGRFSFAAVQNGAARVIGIELGADLVEKSLANMEYYGVPSEQYEFLVGDIYELIDQIEQVDVVFCFGILYHVNAHMLLLNKIADRDPRTVIIDTNISLLEPPVIELRGPVHGRRLQLGESVEGYPSRAALDAMLSSLEWKYEYFDWEKSGLLERAQMRDYLRAIPPSTRRERRDPAVRRDVLTHARVSVVVDCNREDFSPEQRRRAVQKVLDAKRDPKAQWLPIAIVASELGVKRHALSAWVRKAEQAAAQQAGTPEIGNAPAESELLRSTRPKTS
jgi:transposase-like protein